MVWHRQKFSYLVKSEKGKVLDRCRTKMGAENRVVYYRTHFKLETKIFPICRDE